LSTARALAKKDNAFVVEREQWRHRVQAIRNTFVQEREQQRTAEREREKQREAAASSFSAQLAERRRERSEEIQRKLAYLWEPPASLLAAPAEQPADHGGDATPACAVGRRWPTRGRK
jgi:hypothetical protein